MPETIRCEKCGADIILLPAASEEFIRLDPNLWMRKKGVCLKCGHEIQRVMYKCRNCDMYTPHKYLRTTDKPCMVYVCERCRTEKHIYIGLRKSPERSMMSGV